MKKFRSLLCVILSLLLLFSLAACGGNGQGTAGGNADGGAGGEEAGGESGAASTGDFNIYLAGATPGGGGVWDMIGAGLAEAIMRSNPKAYVTVVPGGGVSDIPIVSDGEAEIGLTHSSIAVAAEKGIDPFEEVYDNIVGVAALYPSMVQFIVTAEGPDSIQQIVDEQIPLKIAVGDPGSTGELATKRMLEAYGVTYEDIESWGGKVYYKDMGEAATMLGDGLIDSFTLLTLAPAGPLQQVASSKAVKILDVDEAVIDKMITDFGYSRLDVAKDAYNFLEKDVVSFGSKVVVVANADRSEEEIYHVVRSMVENLEYICSIHSNLSNLTKEEMAKTDVTLHPGAAKYYEEIGVL